MNTKFSYRTMAIFMAFLMFSSSIGFSMDIHFCGGKLESFSFFGNTEACEMMQAKQEREVNHSCCKAPQKEIKNYHDNEITKGNCCQNKTLVLDNGGEFETIHFSIEQTQQLFIVSVALIYYFNIVKIITEQINYAQYSPPPIIKDISIHHQVFRI